MIKKNTEKEYSDVVDECRRMYSDKMQDYGPSWRVFRPSSLTDQILIKARRIRNIQIQKVQKIKDDIRGEFIGIVNYSVMALIQLDCGLSESIDIEKEEALDKYNAYIQKSFDLMSDKNSDYGEAWRSMRVDSLTDIILVKLLRIKQIEDNQGKTIVSEGLDANYMDIVNYAVFALILINEDLENKQV